MDLWNLVGRGRMARALRIEYAGAVCHVMARGNQGQRICADDGDLSMWLATLSEAWRRTGWRIHAWALMSNHLPFINMLGQLAKRMVEAKDPAEADRLQEQIERGFYGGQAHA